MVENKLLCSNVEVKPVSRSQDESEANGGCWGPDPNYSLEKTSTAEGALRPQRRLSALWFTLRDRELGWVRSYDLMGTCCLNNQSPLGSRACVQAGGKLFMGE